MDVRCVVCGEPWDFMGIDNGDMLKWEAKQFHAGAGCPSCEGETPEEGSWEPEDITDVEYGDLDPMERLNALSAVLDGSKPAWGRPVPVTNWTCSGCGAVSQVDPDDDETVWYRPPSSMAAKWWHSHAENRLGDPTEPRHKFSEDLQICEACHKSCFGCEAGITPNIEWGDVYDAGWCGQSYDGEWYCADCMPGGEDLDEDASQETSEA